jgi:hypothetical protein
MARLSRNYFLAGCRKQMRLPAWPEAKTHADLILDKADHGAALVVRGFRKSGHSLCNSGMFRPAAS